MTIVSRYDAGGAIWRVSIVAERAGNATVTAEFATGGLATAPRARARAEATHWTDETYGGRDGQKD